jgi:hypothetical protein
MSRSATLRYVVLMVTALCPHPLRAAPVQDQQQMDELFAAIDGNRDSHVAFLQKLIRAQPDGEEAVQALMAGGCAARVPAGACSSSVTPTPCRSRRSP